MALCCLLGATVRAEPAPAVPLECQLKAAFLYKFIKFVEWPPEVWDGSRALVVGMIGDSPMREALGTIAGKEANHHRLVIRHFGDADSLEFCHVLFVDRTQDADLDSIMSRVKGDRTLTVGETRGFMDSGGMIRFMLVDNRLRFEVDVESARAADLRISSRLLNLAIVSRSDG
jgi:hypothetical protein